MKQYPIRRRSRPLAAKPLALWASALVQLAAAAAIAAPGVPLADAPPGGAEGARYFYEQAQRYEIRRAGETVPLKLVASPLLNWSNPARTSENGILVVWLRQGRPEALATMFTYQIGQRVYEKHELLSLSEAPLTAEFGGRRAWAPAAPGVKLTALEEATPPAAQPRLRALQMRRIARDFTGSMTNGKRETTVLRQLPQPLYRYERVSGDLIDGAIFSLNIGTDPEALVVVEARRGESAPRWHYGLARLHYNELRVERQGKHIWTAEAIPELMKDLNGQAKYMSQSYYTYYPQTLLAGAVAAP